VPEPDYPPPRPPARSYRPDRDEEDPPPWANLPPVRPSRSRRPAGPGHPARQGGGPGGYGGPAGRHAGPGPRGPGPGGPGAPDRADQRALAGARRGSDPPAPSNPSSPGSLEPVPSWAQWDEPEADGDEELPPPRPREPGGRALRAAARRRRRWFVMAGSLAVVAGAVLAVVLLTGGNPGPASVTPGALITTFQAGELRQVPNACHIVPAATVQLYLPGQPKVASPLPVNGSAESACNWTIDKPPLYRLMELNLLAYAPNGLASGNGSATRAATDAYELALQDMQAPPKHSPAGTAAVTVLSGFGDQAFSAVQVYHVAGAASDVATVVVRYHNVVVTAKLNGLAHSNRGNYGPVSQSQLAAAAMAFARAAEAALH